MYNPGHLPGREKIVEMVARNQITVDEGVALIKALRGSGVSAALDIAVIGMSGQFPGARDVNEFWENLTAGKSAVQEIPRDRPGWEKLPQGDLQLGCKGGAFLSGIDRFDPYFFNLSSREAEMMDPRQRLFLQEAWKALEDAGYPETGLYEKSCGVFVGCQEGDYTKAFAGEINPYIPTGNSNSILAARIAYFLNLKGPSLAVDTACSSALAAVHLACHSLRSGTCQLALAGGVLVMATPLMMMGLDNLGMFSPTGRCSVFDNDADGTVIGEAVGVVVLKPLEAALKDRDHIYGVIKGSGMNQDGKTNGITAPSGPSQTALEEGVYRAYNLHPETIGYVEAHGTGTRLGDPIEIQSLTDAFCKFTSKKQYCAIGSVKSNIGHSMPASGISSLVKVLHCLNHKKLVPSLNFQKENEHILFKESPFYVNTRLRDWDVAEDSPGPRRAAISSFGFSGTNCHLVVEEAPPRQETSAHPPKPYHLLLLSAKTTQALDRKLADLGRWLEEKGEHHSLEEIAYTLHLRRTRFPICCAVIAADLGELKQTLKKILKGQTCENYWFNRPKEPKPGYEPALRELGKHLLQELGSGGTCSPSQYREKLSVLADLWIKGMDLDGEILYGGNGYRCISLPPYPFAGESYWIPPGERVQNAAEPAIDGTARLHPLIHRNTSTLKSQRFTTRVMGQEFYMTDHEVNDLHLVPGVVYLEMARAAGSLAGEGEVRKIKNHVWMRPLSRGETPLDLEITLSPDAKGRGVDYEVRGTGENRQRVYAQGTLLYGKDIPDGAPPVPGTVDLDSVKKRCNQRLSGTDCYRLFEKSGYRYGPGFQPLKELYVSQTEALSSLELPPGLKRGFSDFVLHPTLMDGAVQTVMGVMGSSRAESQPPHIPFVLGELEILNPVAESCYVYLTQAGEVLSGTKRLKKYHIHILDRQGKVLVSMKDFSLGGLKPESRIESPTPAIETAGRKAGTSSTLYFRSVWEKSGEIAGRQPTGPAALSGEGPIVVFAGGEELRDVLIKRLVSEKEVILVKPGLNYRHHGGGVYEIHPGCQADYRRLVASFKDNHLIPTKIIHNWSQEAFTLHDDSIRHQLEKSVYSLIYLTGALMEQKPPHPIRLLYLYPGPGSDTSFPNPFYAAVSGLASTIPLENAKFLYKTLCLEGSEKFCGGPGGGFSKEPPGRGGMNLPDLLLEEFHREDGVEIRWAGGERYTRRWQEIDLNPASPAGAIETVNLRENGVYLITGGLGGLGLIFAQYLARQVKARLVLAGRSAPNPEKDAVIHRLESLGAKAIYLPADVSRLDQVKTLIRETRDRLGEINGIIHSAGVNRDSLVIKKTAAEIEAVLSPKVYGTIYLDEASRDESLDFFVLFSSTAALLGNRGQSDYAYANRFMDYFVQVREELRKKRQRKGKTLSIAWPLWKEGGMTVDNETEKMVAHLFGMTPLPTDSGIAAFLKALSGDESQLAVLEGEPSKIRELVAAGHQYAQNRAGKSPGVSPLPGVDENRLSKNLRESLLEIAAGFVTADGITIEPEADLQEYGFDSITLTAFSNEINKRFDLGITPAIFFELDEPTIASLVKYLLNEYRDRIILHYGKSLQEEEEVNVPGPGEVDNNVGEQRFFPTVHRDAGAAQQEVAIIGMSGIMPGSDNLEIFWEHLEAGRDLITEAPGERWGWKVSKDNLEETGWGGFMKEVDKFDAEFFNISPREAKMMDPQQRIFLEIVWKTIEDAGYKSSALSGTKTALFVGISNSDYYEMLLKHSLNLDPYASITLSNSLRANRISYLLNLHGPSEPIDTACSSSLVAIHRGVEALRSGTCEMAIVGGVNAMVSPTLFQAFNSAGMLSADGRCRAFDREANGYVRGEGAGALLLKPLSHAVADGDHIYAVIRGTAENHGGRANSLTAPNANAQAQLIVDAYEGAQVDPGTVSYIEAHGTATALGDPVEINALKKAFRELYRKRGNPMPQKPYCGIGSVKTNVGHLEAAAGIAGIIKVLLAMKYKKLPAHIHFQELSPYIDLNRTPFYIVKETRPWECMRDETGQPLPRRAGVSSFGYGGTNAHVVLEEWPAAQDAKPTTQSSATTPRLVVLSAKNEDRLNAYVKQMIDFLAAKDTSWTQPVDSKANTAEAETYRIGLRHVAAKCLKVKESDIDDDMELSEYGLDRLGMKAIVDHIVETYEREVTEDIFSRYASIDALVKYLCGDGTGRRSGSAVTSSSSVFSYVLEDIAYTLQMGRDAMEQRLALVVSDITELREKLEQYSRGMRAINGVFQGRLAAKRDDLGLPGREAEKEREKLVQTLVTQKDLPGIARLYVSGWEIDWRLLYPDREPRRVSLPTYPFTRERHWFDDPPHQQAREARPAAAKLALKPISSPRYSGVDGWNPRPGGSPIPSTIAAEPSTIIDPDLVGAIKEMLAEVLFMSPEKVDMNKPFKELGLDSILGVEFAKKLKERFQVDLRATKLYDYPTVNVLADYLGNQTGKAGAASGPTVNESPKVLEKPGTAGEEGRQNPRDVAIIGMSARYPGADNISIFWENIKNGIDSVSEVPADRWDIHRYYDADVDKPGKTYSKWGGFLHEIDRFDPLFFSISPAEAEWLDPQQRLFLQEAWRALEDAGYSAASLNNRKCGVYVGVMSGEPYYANMLNAHSILAARISYFLNLKGPAISIDTACSSSLVAMHLACRSLISGETDMMLAGGVTLYLTVNPYIGMCKSMMLSRDGKCKTFDNRADGFVPGEGVGAVVLKLLEKAIADGDHIYGIIKGSGINQDGRTNGITAPSAQAQTALESDVYNRSGIDPVTISYVEAHGTGTKLGDPIEIEALTEAFRHYTSKKQYCPIGSVKSNLGHTSAASGLAGVIKVLMALKHKKIPPTLHFQEENQHIDFAGSPFYVNTKLQEWKKTGDFPRRAAVSSFGYSGTNAHLVLEEPPPQGLRKGKILPPLYFIPISAKTQAGVKERLRDLADWLEREGRDHWLGDIAYTLGRGRSHFDLRAVLLARDVEELAHTIKQALTGDAPGNYFSHKPGPPIPSDQGTREEGTALIGGVRSLDKLSPGEYKDQLTRWAEGYVKGNDPDWAVLYPGDSWHRVSLPTYPFVRQRCWISPGAPAAGDTAAEPTGGVKANPLLGIAKSTPTGKRFELRLTGEEFFLADNVVYGQKVLPGVAYLEIARAAAETAGQAKVRKIENLVWLSLITLDTGPRQVEISLSPDHQTGGLDFEVSTADENARRVVNTRGKIVYENPHPTPHQPAPQPIDIEGVKKRCPGFMKGADCYKGYREREFIIGPRLQAMQELYYSESEALSLLQLPPGIKGGSWDFVLHPSLMDAVLQTVTGLMIDTPQERGRPYLSFALEETEIFRPLPEKGWGYARVSEHQVPGSPVKRFDMWLLDTQGHPVVSMKNFCLKKALGPSPVGTVSPGKEEPGEVQDEGLKRKIEADVAGVISTLLKMDKTGIDIGKPLLEYGFTSITMTDFINRINKRYGIRFAIESFFDLKQPTIESLAGYLQHHFRDSIVGCIRESEGQELPPVEAVLTPAGSGEGGPVEEEPQLVTLSASNKERLKAYAGRMVDFLKKEGATSPDSKETGSTGNLFQKIEDDILPMASEILRSGKEGYDPASVDDFARGIHRRFNLEVSPTLFLEVPSIGTFIKNLAKDYRDRFEEYYRERSNTTNTTGLAGIALKDLAYTLQVESEEMPERLAVIATTPIELVEKLSAYGNARANIPGLYTGRVNKVLSKSLGFIDGKEGEAYIRLIVKNRNLARLAQLWVLGVPIEWESLYPGPGGSPKRISLPRTEYSRGSYHSPKAVKSKRRKPDA